MTKEQIELVRELISAINDGDSRRESNLILKLRLTALDAQVKGADWHDHHPAYPQDSTGTPQVKTTTTTSGSVFPPAPSTPQPVGFNYKQENYVQSLKDSLGKMINEMAADIHKKDKTIESLKTRLDSANNNGQNLTNKLMAEQARCVELQKRVESLSTVINDGRVERCSLTETVRNRGDEIHKQATEIAALKKKIEDLYKVIDEMAKQKPDEGDCERAIIALDLLTADLARMDRRVNGHADVIAEKNKAIEMLNNQVELLTKRIKEDRNHFDDKAASADEYRKHNNELVAANAEIYDSLRHWGLEQTEPCSLVNNVKQVIQLCAERGKTIGERAKSIELLTADLARMDRRVSEKNILINQLHASLNKRGEAMTKLSEDNKKLSEALNSQVEANQKLADNVAQLRHEKSLDEQGYIKKLTEKSLRIAVLKDAGNALHRELKNVHKHYPVVSLTLLRNWENETK